MHRRACRIVSALLCSFAWQAAAAPRAEADPVLGNASAASLFRIVREPVPGGAELLTVYGRVDAGFASVLAAGAGSVPLVSVLRDTLGDDDPENDRLRYVWMHGYTRPSFGQRLASAVPFLNMRVGNKDLSDPVPLPPAVVDISAPERDVWKNVMWVAAQTAFVNPYGAAARTSVRAFRRNDEDYRKAHIVRALAVLAAYEADTGAQPVLTPVEMRDIQARLVLAQTQYGGIVRDASLRQAYENDMTSRRDVRGHNWELLRQRAEAERLYFEPLSMPDGSMTHALLWVARRDVDQSGRTFNKRFLNIASPWGDTRLLDWSGYSEIRHFDADGRRVPPDAPDGEALELIPLALYGLDHPKIPALLVDFRDQGNPKRRELTRRLLDDITRSVLSLSPFGDIQYFLGRTAYNFITGRRGMDINQPSRLRSYSMLKLMLSLSDSIDPALAAETGRLIERVSMNPLQNDVDVEAELARRSHEALMEASRHEGGSVAKRLERDRRAELTRLEHGATEFSFLRVATILTGGLYRHREDDPPEVMLARLDVSRRVTYHRRFVEEVLATTPLAEVGWNIADVRRSLQFIADQHPSDGKTVTLAARLFDQTRDRDARRLSLDCLARANTRKSHEALARIYRSPDVEPALRALALAALTPSGIEQTGDDPRPFAVASTQP
jgi:hypothetical protein